MSYFFPHSCKQGSYHAEKVQAKPGSSHQLQRGAVLPSHPGHSDLHSSSALLQPIEGLVLIWHLPAWWMQVCQESTGRSTDLWPKRRAKEKKGEHRTDRKRGTERNRETSHTLWILKNYELRQFYTFHVEKVVVSNINIYYWPTVIGINYFRYHVSSLPPVIGICLKDVHRLRVSTVVGSSRCLSWKNLSCYTPSISSVFAVFWSTPHIILRCSRLDLLSQISCRVSQSVGISHQWTLDGSLLSDCALIINVLQGLSSHGQTADLWPLQLEYIGDINTWGGKVEQVVNSNMITLVFLLCM